MGNDGKPRPGYDFWVTFDGHGRLNNPKLNEDGTYVQHEGYITDIMNRMAVDYVRRKHQETLVAVLRPQGGASRRRAGSRRHVRLEVATAPRNAIATSTAGAYFRRSPTCSRRPKW